ncbi:hypothetical protein AB0C38_25965 [Amycolatopsis sp. NPDC048633]|uniref:hypothetical protein n=1 Tax=Amycolatopsis sp. NPDC048633 TaxID=3157095 RepID=UPI00340A98E8
MLPRVEIAIEPAPLDLPSVVRPAPVEAADVPVALLRTLDEPAPESAQAEAAPESDPVELRWRPDAREPEPVAYPEPASAPAEPVVLGAPEPVEPAEPSEPVVMATPVPSAELRVDHAAKSVESAKRGKPEREPEPDDRGSRHAGGDEVGEQVISDAEVVILPAGER